MRTETILRGALLGALALLAAAAGPLERPADARRDEAALATHLALIPWVRDELAQRDIALVVRLVPDGDSAGAGSANVNARAHRALSASGVVTSIGAAHETPAGAARVPILLIGAAGAATHAERARDGEVLPDNLLRYGAPGDGPFVPMLDYLLNGPDLPLQPRLVVWEIDDAALTRPRDLRVERRGLECEPSPGRPV